MINPVFLKALMVEKNVMNILKRIPHQWVEVKDGAVVFFNTPKTGKKLYLAFPLPNIDNNAFYEAVGRLPQVIEIENGKFNAKEKAEARAEAKIAEETAD